MSHTLYIHIIPYLYSLFYCVLPVYSYNIHFNPYSPYPYPYSPYPYHPRRSPESGGLHQLPPDPPGPVEGRLDYE